MARRPADRFLLPSTRQTVPRLHAARNAAAVTIGYVSRLGEEEDRVRARGQAPKEVTEVDARRSVRRPGRPAGARTSASVRGVLALSGVVGSLTAGALGAQEADSAGLGPPAARDTTPLAAPVSPDSADRLRAALERPPSGPPADVYDVLSFPLRVAMLPLSLVGRGIQGIAGLAFRPAPPNPVVVAIRDVRAWGLSPALPSFGPRAGVGGGLRLERFEPFFLETGISVRGSQRHVAGMRVGEAGGPGASVAGGFRRYAEPHFWGIGPDTEPESAADFRWDQVQVSGAGWIPTEPVTWRLELGFEENDVGRGSDGETPDLQDIAPPEGAFGLREETRFVRLGVGAALDWTRIHGLQPRGLRAELGGAAFLGTGGTDADFLRWHADLSGYLPLNERQQLALRGLVEANRPQGGRGVPFTHLASLGGTRGLRGFDSDRFRDFDLVALQSEWRYEIWRSIHDDIRQEGFVFLDAGSVARRIDELDASDLRTGYGFGMRTATDEGLAFLWWLAFSGEGTKFRLRFSWPF